MEVRKMEIKVSLITALLVSLAFIAGCLEESVPNENPPGYEYKFESMNDLVNSSNDFAFDMYRELLDGEDNIFFSPYSITIALGMAYEGAKGQTAAEMQAVIQLPENDLNRRAMVKALQSSLNPQSASYELSTANAYWLKQGETLAEEYQRTIENDYLAYGEELDFGGDSTGSTDTINEWVEDQTNDRIQDLIPYGLLDAFTYMVLTNAIYFKADWRWQFDVDATRERPFMLSDGTTTSVQMMNICDEEIDLNYAENDDVQMLQLPYKDEELSMYILLPKDNNISMMGSALSTEYLDDLKSDLYGEYVDVRLPKFKFELKYGLNDPLKAMGMVKAFDPDEADFSDMDENEDIGLYISDVIHQSFVEVNEEGTEAAAATAVVVSYGVVDDDEPEPVSFNANHPFVFLIEHQDSGQILFMGKVENPSV